MKKIVISLFTTLLLTTILPIGDVFKNEINAEAYYPIGCSIDEFEVSYIQDDGNLNKVSCHSSFADAKAKMKSSSDYVVRHANSYSPTKIIAMNSGVAYSYPARSGSITMNLYQNLEAKSNKRSIYKYTYITDYYEMSYYDTLVEYESSIKSNGKGFIKTSINGFDGYVELEYVDLVPSKYIDKGIAIYVGGDHGGECLYNKESPYYVVCKKNYYSIDRNGNYYDLVYHYYSDYIDGSNHECYFNEIHVDNAANYLNAGMKSGVKYYSNDGINFYSDSNCKNFVTQVYGYYQFLSLRSKTNISASTFNSFLTSLGKNNSVMLNQGQSFINAQNTYGSNALLIFAMACQESGYGESGYARNNNNLFGWGAYDSNPDNAYYFSSVEQCINEHMGRNLNWFMDCTNWRYAGTCIGNKGTGINVVYSSDPYWGLKIAAIAYRIDKYSNNNNGNLTDYNNFTVGVVDSNYNPSFGINTSNWITPFYKNATGGDVLYYSKFNDNYQKDLTVVINEKIGDRYKINICNPIINGTMYVEDGCVAYDWNSSCAYIDCNRVSIINNKDISYKGEATYKNYNCINSLSLENNILTIEGLGVIQGTDFNTANGSSHQIVFYSFLDNSEAAVFNAENIDSDGYDMNDGYNYKYAGFKATIDLTSNNLTSGNYYISLRTTNEGHTVEDKLKTSSSKYRNNVSSYNGLSYKLTANMLSNYRLELDILDSPLNYTEISKPSARSSMVSFDSIVLDDDGNLNIFGQGLIEYVDFNDSEKVEFSVYLIKDRNDYLELDTSFNTSDQTNYTEILNSEYDLTYISFVASTKTIEKNTFDLNEGNYSLILKIKNTVTGTTYTDILEFTNRGNSPLNSISNDVKNISLITSNTRKRVELVVEENKIENGD